MNKVRRFIFIGFAIAWLGVQFAACFKRFIALTPCISHVFFHLYHLFRWLTSSIFAAITLSFDTMHTTKAVYLTIQIDFHRVQFFRNIKK